MQKHNRMVVFPDIDGVLNIRTTCQRTPDGFTGIDDARVEILASAIAESGGGDIILSSDWKNLRKTDDDYLYLVEKLGRYGLQISGCTTDNVTNRGYGVLCYLDEHPEIEEFVILDDNKFDFEDYQILWERLLLTNRIERAEYASRTPAVEAILFLDYIKSC